MIRMLIRLLLLAGLAYGGVVFFYDWMDKKLQITPKRAVTGAGEQVVPGSPPPADTSSNRPDYSIIVERNIFQARLAGGVGPETSEEETLDPTSLKLTLSGTIIGNDQDSRAIIVDGTSKQEDIYHLGDEIQGALIDSIERGKVVLEVNGVREVLLIKDPEAGSRGRPGAASAAAEVPVVELSPEPEPPSEVQPRVPEARPHRLINIREPFPETAQVAEPEMPIQSSEEEGQGQAEAEMVEPEAEGLPAENAATQ